MALPNATNPLILIPRNVAVHEILAIAAVYSNFREQAKNVRIALNSDSQVEEALKAVIPNVSILNKIEPSHYQISLATDDAVVENVEWEVSEGKLNMYFQVGTGELNTKSLKINKTGSEFDHIIVVARNNLDDFGEIGTSLKQLKSTLKFYGVGVDLNLEDKFVFDSTYFDTLDTLAEQVLTSFENSELKRPTANYLLASVLNQTQDFKIEVKNSELFISMKKLFDSGASIGAARELINKLIQN